MLAVVCKICADTRSKIAGIYLYFKILRQSSGANFTDPKDNRYLCNLLRQSPRPGISPLFEHFLVFRIDSDCHCNHIDGS